MKYPDFTQTARDDLREAWLYIASDNIAAADRLVDEIDAVCEMLAQHPHAGVNLHGAQQGLRIFTCKQYGVFYIPTEYGVEIHRILHGARDVAKTLTQFP